ncbi:MAG: aromatic-ring-hydroxylating dioxygenase subunit beta [Pseudomonadota bacterium]|nr:aromatic-ring-hydroxylating dioxygenase subunit beta [Pseudomonadota bacterium]
MKLTAEDLIQFIIHECRLLDECKYEEWLDLFLDEGIYWMPLDYGQTEEKLTTSLLYEDKLLLRTRVLRYANDRTYSQNPKSRCQHLLQVPTVDSMDVKSNDYRVYTPFHYVEYRKDKKQEFDGWMRHSLQIKDDLLRIKMKRVDLINCDAPHHNIQLFI